MCEIKGEMRIKQTCELVICVCVCVCACVCLSLSLCNDTYNLEPQCMRCRYECQKRPITMSKETYYNVKRDLLQIGDEMRIHKSQCRVCSV